MTVQMGLAVSAGALVLVGAAVLGDRVVSRQARKDRITVVYWEKWTGFEEKEMRKVVEAFNRSQNRIFVKYLSISNIDRKTMLATAGGNPPDISGIWQDQVCQFADNGALSDLTDLARENELGPDHYIRNYWDALNYRGKLWALPSTPASIALHVRTDLVPKEYATPETFPQTLEGVDRIVDRISKKKKDGSLIMAGYLPSNPGWWQWSWGYFFGGRLLDGDRLTINCKENVRAFTWIQGYAKRFGSKEVQSFQGGFGNFGSAQDPFMIGKVAMEFNGPWKGKYIEDFSPGTPWFAVPIPHPEDRPDLAERSNLSQDVLVIPRGAKHAKEAFEFIRYVQRQDVMEGLCSSHGKNSPLNKVSEHFFNTHPNKYIRLFDRLARSKGAFSPPLIGIYPQISSEMGVAFEEVNTQIKTPQQALDDAQKRLEGIWKTYRQQVLGESL